MKTILRTTLILLLALLIFTGCSLRTPSPESGKIALDERIRDAVLLPDTDPDRVEYTVADYLLAWQFPSFETDTFASAEGAYAPRFYESEEAVFTIARTCAQTFSDSFYTSIHLSDASQVTSKLLRAYVLALKEASADFPFPTAEELSDRIRQDACAAQNGVAIALASWEFPLFYIDKFLMVESLFDVCYYKDLPPAQTLATDSARCFIDTLYASTDLSDPEAVTDALIRSYVLSVGDRYAYYRTADEYSDYNSDMSGTFVGVGITVEYSYADETVRITAVYDDSPAEKAGLRVGDYLYAVDGALLSEYGYTETINRIRGEVGTSVEISVDRGGEILTFTAVREKLTERTVTYSAEDGIGTIRITEFKDNTGAQFREAIDALEAAGVDAILFDLRSNPGGYLVSVVNAISYLVPTGTPIVSFGDYASPIVSQDAHTISVPCVVLCDGYTASAGELFTAALRDYNDMGLLDATVVGETTYKKGIMQSTYFLPDSSTVTLTVSQYNPPCGINYDGIGITPDIPVEPSEGNTDTALERGYEILRSKLQS